MTKHVSTFAVRSLESLDRLGYGGSIERTILGKQCPSGKITVANLAGDRLSYANTHARYVANGVLSDHAMNVGMILDCDNYQVRSINTQPGDFFILPQKTEIAAVHDGHVSYFVKAVDPLRMVEIADLEGIDFDPKALTKPNFFRLGPEWVTLSVKYARSICDVASDREASLNLERARSHDVADKLLSDDLTRLILYGLVRADVARVEADAASLKSQKVIRGVRQILMKKLQNQEYGDRFPTLDTLARELGVSRRGLFRTFRSEMGITPAKYLRLYRLSRAHSELVYADKNHSSVTQTALNWGFGDFGRFAGEYRTYFGELPSNTLAKPATEQISVEAA